MPEQRPRGFPERFPVRDDLGRPLRYTMCSLTCRGAARLCFAGRLRIEGRERVPLRGPLILAANHLSFLDPLLLGGFTPGALACMAKAELFANPVVAWTLGGSNVFPVERGSADRQALRVALDLLERGGRLLLFIEGTRTAAAGMRRAEPGVGFLLRRRPVPVVPVAITGTEAALVRGRLLPRPTIRVRYGEPVRVRLDDLSARDHQALADRVAGLVAGLLPPAYRGHYAGTADGQR